MIGLKRYITVALPVVYLMFASHVDASDVDFCAMAVDKELCGKMVEGATNWNEAITKAVTATIEELVRASKSGDSLCKKPYKEAEQKLMESLEMFRKGEDKDNTLNPQLVIALAYLEDCTNALKDLKQDASPEMTINNTIEQAMRVCLTIDTSSKSDGSSSSKSSADANKSSYTIIS